MLQENIDIPFYPGYYVYTVSMVELIFQRMNTVYVHNVLFCTTYSKYGYFRFHSDPISYAPYSMIQFTSVSCRAVEESLAESKQTANMMGFTSMSYFTDPLNPHERRRQGDLPVGLKNVGNSCWFNVAIQVLYCTKDAYNHFSTCYSVCIRACTCILTATYMNVCNFHVIVMNYTVEPARKSTSTQRPPGLSDH